ADAIMRAARHGPAHGTAARTARAQPKAKNILPADQTILAAATATAAALRKPATARNGMAAPQALVREMLTGRRPNLAEEPVERARTLPAWFSEWMGFRWSDAGKALAAMRPPPPPSSHSSQLFA